MTTTTVNAFFTTIVNQQVNKLYKNGARKITNTKAYKEYFRLTSVKKYAHLSDDELKVMAQTKYGSFYD